MAKNKDNDLTTEVDKIKAELELLKNKRKKLQKQDKPQKKILKKKAAPKKPVEKKKAAPKKPVEKKKAAAKKPVEKKKAAAKKPVETKKAVAKKAVDKKKAAIKKAEDKKKVAIKKAEDKKKAAIKKAEDKKKAAIKKAEDKKKAAEKKAEEKKKEEETMRTLEEQLEEQLTDKEIENFKIEKVDMEKLTNKVCEIIADYEAKGMLQSELWKKLKLSSRDGSRLALRLERRGIITREKLLEKGRWTYKLILKKTPISTESIVNAPCLTCPVESKCTLEGEVSPRTCQWIEDWVLIEMKQTKTRK